MIFDRDLTRRTISAWPSRRLLGDFLSNLPQVPDLLGECRR